MNDHASESHRFRAVKYADREVGRGKRDTVEWRRAYNGYCAGWTALSRMKLKDIRSAVQGILVGIVKDKVHRT